MAAPRLQSTLHFSVKVNVLCVRSVDTLGQTFEAHAVFRLHTLNLDEVEREDNITINEQSFDFGFRFLNLVSTEIWKMKTKRSNDQIMVKLEVSGKFSQQMMLGFFPFDVQTLHMQLTSSLPVTCLCFESNFDQPSVVTRNTFGASNVYQLHPDPFLISGQTNKVESTSGTIRPAFEVCLRIRRSPSNFLFNIMLPMLLITSVPLVSYASNRDSRFGTCQTMMLTAVAFKQFISSQLPQISYLTTADYFLLQCFVFICVVTVVTGLSKFIEEKHDIYYGYTFLSVYVLILISWFVKVLLLVRNSKQRLSRPSYLDRCDRLEPNTIVRCKTMQGPAVIGVTPEPAEALLPKKLKLPPVTKS
mmetsp:Transcript_13507/g.26208  ORF Transcript_13507/g.26208 Transcript_13507/m.26208 type:complete len:360 (-) Transcript_13507:216-1295(-)